MGEDLASDDSDDMDELNNTIDSDDMDEEFSMEEEKLFNDTLHSFHLQSTDSMLEDFHSGFPIKKKKKIVCKQDEAKDPGYKKCNKCVENCQKKCKKGDKQ